MAVLLRLEKFSYRFAEQVLNSKLALKQEIEKIITAPDIGVSSLSRPKFNEILEERFVKRGWESQPSVFDEPKDRARYAHSELGVALVLF